LIAEAGSTDFKARIHGELDLYEENDKRQKGVYEDRIEGFRKKEEKPRMREMRLD